MKSLLLLLVFAMGCGVTLHSDPVHIDPIQVNHTITINVQGLTSYYTSLCAVQFTVQSDIAACVNEKIVEFNNAYNAATGG